MGGHWLPDPPVGSSLSDEISAPSVIIVDSDNDDGIDIVENDIEVLGNYNEYRLLTDGDNMTDGEDDTSDDGVSFSEINHFNFQTDFIST